MTPPTTKPVDQAPVNRGGRPRVTEPRTSVSVWLPASAHERLYQLAQREAQSISATVRQLLILRLK